MRFSTRKLAHWVFVFLVVIPAAFLFLGGGILACLFVDPLHTFAFVGFLIILLALLLSSSHIDDKIEHMHFSGRKRNAVRAIALLCFLILVFILYRLGEKAGIAATGPGPYD